TRHLCGCRTTRGQELREQCRLRQELPKVMEWLPFATSSSGGSTRTTTAPAAYAPPSPVALERWIPPVASASMSVKRENGFTTEEVGASVGPAFGFYRIAVEFFAILAALISNRLYLAAKGAAALLLYPIKWLDPLMQRSPAADRICGGYYVIARKPAASEGTT